MYFSSLSVIVLLETPFYLVVVDLSYAGKPEKKDLAMNFVSSSSGQISSCFQK